MASGSQYIDLTDLKSMIDYNNSTVDENIIMDVVEVMTTRRREISRSNKNWNDRNH